MLEMLLKLNCYEIHDSSKVTRNDRKYTVNVCKLIAYRKTV